MAVVIVCVLGGGRRVDARAEGSVPPGDGLAAGPVDGRGASHLSCARARPPDRGSRRPVGRGRRERRRARCPIPVGNAGYGRVLNYDPGPLRPVLGELLGRRSLRLGGHRGRAVGQARAAAEGRAQRARGGQAVARRRAAHPRVPGQVGVPAGRAGGAGASLRERGRRHQPEDARALPGALQGRRDQRGGPGPRRDAEARVRPGRSTPRARRCVRRASRSRSSSACAASCRTSRSTPASSRSACRPRSPARARRACCARRSSTGPTWWRRATRRRRRRRASSSRGGRSSRTSRSR